MIVPVISSGKLDFEYDHLINDKSIGMGDIYEHGHKYDYCVHVDS